MDLEKIFSDMPEEEKHNYFNKDTMEYYKYIKGLPEFQNIEKKLNNKEKLTEEEWEFILNKLFLVFIRSLDEENRIALLGRLFLLFAKINTKVLKQGSPAYNRLYKLTQLIMMILIASSFFTL